jgi:hypothetical protein
VAACEPADALDLAIGIADEALYRAKSTGRNCVVGERLATDSEETTTLVRATV